MSQGATGFDHHTLNEHVNALANFMPNGCAFSGKFIEESKFRQSIRGLAHEFQRLEDSIVDFAEETDPNITTLYIQEFERDLGIPDGCFPGTGTLEERRRDIVVKIGLDGITTRQEFIDLAALYGFDISITADTVSETPFPVVFPWLFSGNGQVERFTMVVTFNGESNASAFPVVFPWVFGDNRNNNIIECLFERLVPASVDLRFIYSEDIVYIVDEFGNRLVDEFGNFIIK